MATLGQKLAKQAGTFIRCAQELSLPVTATANTDYAAIALPAGAHNITYRTITTTAYTASTDAKISIGSTAGGVDYVAATTILAVGVKSHTPVDAAAAVHLAPGALTLFVRVTQTGTPTAVGAATLIIDYSLPVS
jgi:hypothetical protein